MQQLGHSVAWVGACRIWTNETCGCLDGRRKKEERGRERETKITKKAAAASSGQGPPYEVVVSHFLCRPQPMAAGPLHRPLPASFGPGHTLREKTLHNTPKQAMLFFSAQRVVPRHGRFVLHCMYIVAHYDEWYSPGICTYRLRVPSRKEQVLVRHARYMYTYSVCIVCGLGTNVVRTISGARKEGTSFGSKQDLARTSHPV